MTDTAALKKRIEISGLKQEFIAKKIGLSSYGFAKKRDNESEFKPSEIDALCRILHIDTLEERFAIFFANEGAFNETCKGGD